MRLAPEAVDCTGSGLLPSYPGLAMLGPHERAEDALLLWREGRREGAFLLAIVAVIARSRRDFPPPMSEGESFGRFMESKFPTRISVEYRGKVWPLEQIFYKWFRCEIVHRGGPLRMPAHGVAATRRSVAPEY